eukprot:TRINITY_DN10677_c0_g1_i7.p1 TRINITY_DN10677_c0_g1~~TRINITY_DN10677_c0_g1_i7.p1  ORF type:complete len:258 (-),score=46.61 TRINITY_DN10677_c0_g1_i7:253-1026(-)
MSGIGTGYDLSAGTFSPDGKVFQTEYAQKAVDNSGTTIGMKVKNGIVLAVERVVQSKLMVEGSFRRIHNVEKHAGIAVCGFPPDGRTVVSVAQDESADYKKYYGQSIPGHVLAERIATYMHLFNLYGALRPFGCSLLLATHDEKNGFQLYQIEPSGNYGRYFGTSVGKARQATKTEIENMGIAELDVRQAVFKIVKMMHKVREGAEETKPFELEMSWVCEESDYKHQRIPQQLIQEATEAALAEIRAEEMDEDDDED